MHASIQVFNNLIVGQKSYALGVWVSDVLLAHAEVHNLVLSLKIRLIRFTYLLVWIAGRIHKIQDIVR